MRQLVIMRIAFTGIDRVTHDEDRLREARYWATRSIAERVIAGWELTESNLIAHNLISLDSKAAQSDAHEPEKRTGITLRRVVRRRR